MFCIAQNSWNRLCELRLFYRIKKNCPRNKYTERSEVYLLRHGKLCNGCPDKACWTSPKSLTHGRTLCAPTEKMWKNADFVRKTDCHCLPCRIKCTSLRSVHFIRGYFILICKNRRNSHSRFYRFCVMQHFTRFLFWMWIAPFDSLLCRF